MTASLRATTDRPGTRGMVVLIITTAAALVWLTLGMGRGMLVSSDHRTYMWPWAGVLRSVSPQAPVLTDPDQQFVPWLQFARKELRAGRLPLWNPHQDGGVPLLGNGQSALGSPLVWPVLALGVENGWNISLLLRMLLAASGTYLWLRGMARSCPASLLGAAMFSMSGPFIAWLEHPHTLSVAPLPLLLHFIRQHRVAPTRKSAIGTAISTYLILAGGHPETAVMAALFAGTAVVAGSRPGRSLARALPFAVLGCMLAAPLMLPLIEYILHSEAVTGAQRVALVLPVEALVRFLVPGAAAGHPIEAAATVSLVGLALAAVGGFLTRQERSLPWAVAVLLVLLVTYENPFSRWLAGNTLIYWTRALLLLPLALGVLASAGVDAFAAALRRARRTTLPALVVALAPLLAFSELLLAARGVHAVTPAWMRETTTPMLEFLRRDSDVFRVLPLGVFLPPNLATAEELDDLRGYDALAPRGWRQRREAIGEFVNDTVRLDAIRPGGSALDFWNVKYILAFPAVDRVPTETAKALELQVREVYRGADGIVLANLRCLPRARLSGEGRVGWGERTPTHYTLNVVSLTPSELVVANPFYPGWVATVDGRREPISAKPGDPVVIPIQPGQHEVVLDYRPTSFRLGLLVAFVGLLLLAVSAPFLRATTVTERLPLPVDAIPPA